MTWGAAPRAAGPRQGRRRLAGVLAVAALVAGGAGEAPLASYAVEGDGIAAPLAGRLGDAARGRALMLDMHGSTCLLCHAGPFPGPGGTVGPSLAGVGSRLDEGQLRLRLVDAAAVNPGTVMPRFYTASGLTRVAPAYAGRPVLDAGQIEDIVAYLATLREPPARHEAAR